MLKYFRYSTIFSLLLRVHADVEQTSTSPRTLWLGWLYFCVRMPEPGALDPLSVAAATFQLLS